MHVYFFLLLTFSPFLVSIKHFSLRKSVVFFSLSVSLAPGHCVLSLCALHLVLSLSWEGRSWVVWVWPNKFHRSHIHSRSSCLCCPLSLDPKEASSVPCSYFIRVFQSLHCAGTHISLSSCYDQKDSQPWISLKFMIGPRLPPPSHLAENPLLEAFLQLDKQADTLNPCMNE